MGLLKKLTKPLSKFLDKVVPNEIKPALPYLSAFAPFMPGMQGIMGSTMLKRALMSGALNLGSQLSQEGSEGDFDPLSLAMASGIGALSAPGTGATRTMHPEGFVVEGAGQPSAAQFFEGKAAGMEPGWMKSGTEALGTGSKYLTKASQTFQDNPFSKEGLKAAIVPATTGTADLARITAEQALRDFENTPPEDPGGYTDDGRRLAIRSAMEAAGHIEEEILDALASLGLKEGGRVGYIHGGITHADGRRGFFKGAEADARAGRASMSPGTSHSGGMRSGFGGTGNTGTGTTTTTTTPITKTIKTKTINEPIGILANIKNMFRTQDPEDVSLGTGLAEEAKQDIINAVNATKQGLVESGVLAELQNQGLLKQGGRVGAEGGGIMNAKRGFVDGPGGYAGRKLGDILEHGWWNTPENNEPFNQIEYDEKLKKSEEDLQQHGEEDRNFEVDMMMKTKDRLQEDGLEFGDAVEKAEIINYYQYGKGALEGETYRGDDPIILKYLGMTKAQGGRIGYQGGELVEGEVIEESKGDNMLMEIAKVIFRLVPPTNFMFAVKDAHDMYQNLDDEDKEKVKEIGTRAASRFAGVPGLALDAGMSLYDKFKGKKMAEGGVPTVLPRGTEMDYRGGGVIPMGSKERADDVPARLSKNEFVMTADAVRAAGGGSVNKGAKRMYNLMHKLEARV